MKGVSSTDEYYDDFEFKELKTSAKQDLKPTMSSSSTDSGISLRMSRWSVSCLISEVDTSGCTVAEVPWDVSRADLVLKVNNTLFAVHRSLVSLYSDILKNIIFSVNFVDEDAPVVTLMEQTPESILSLLSYIYFQDKDITDANVDDVLCTACNFAVDKVLQRCEVFLMTKSIKSPLAILKLGNKYCMKRLVEFALVRVSKMPELLKLIDKEELGYEIENRILRLMLERYESINNNHHCMIHKNPLTDESECCVRRSKALQSKAIQNFTDCYSSSEGSDDSDDDCDYEYGSDHEYVFKTTGASLS